MSQLPEQIEPQQVQAIPVGPDPQMQMISQMPPQAIPMGQTALPMAQQNLAPGFNTTAMANQGLSMNATDKRRRRSKHELEGRIFLCHCGKSYLSQPALNNHKKTKHPELLQENVKRGRGRPRKYPPTSPGDFESTKYEGFFNKSDFRKAIEGEEIHLDRVANTVFQFLYQAESSDKLFSKPKSVEDNPILKNIMEKKCALNPDGETQKQNKTCDDVFYEYLANFKKETNENYFILLTKFVLLFRECYDISKNKDKSEDEKKTVTNVITPEGLPDLCNEFYGEFMEPNFFFGIKEEKEKSEIIEIIQHFCIWLFKNEYTKSKLSLAA